MIIFCQYHANARYYFSFISLICELFLHSDNNDPSCDNNDHAQTFSFLLPCFYTRDWHSMGTWKISVTSRGTMDWSLPKDGHISYSYHLLITLFIICLLLCFIRRLDYASDFQHSHIHRLLSIPHPITPGCKWHRGRLQKYSVTCRVECK